MKSKDDSRIVMIPMDRIRIVNPRSRDKVKFDLIVKNIAAIGLKKPITVTLAPHAKDGQPIFNLVCGQGRFEAFQSLGQEEIPAFIRGLSKEEGLLASLIENIARRRVGTVDQVKMILWMKQQGHRCPDIARKIGLGEEYVRDILCMLEKGEDRLIEAVFHGRIPITIATQIAGTSDEEARKLLTEAYDSKEMNQKTIKVFKRIVEQRRWFGKSYSERARSNSHARVNSAESLIRAYRQETERQKLMIKKGRLCEARLLSVAAAFKMLFADEDYVTLLRAEKLDTVPKFLADRAKEVA